MTEKEIVKPVEKSSEKVKPIPIQPILDSNTIIDVVDVNSNEIVSILPREQELLLIIDRIYKLPIKEKLNYYETLGRIFVTEEFFKNLQIIGIQDNFVYVLPICNQTKIKNNDVIGIIKPV